MNTVNLAGRAGRWSAAHWKTAAFGWIAFAVVAVVVGSFVGAREMKDWAIANGESRRAAQMLDEANFKIPARESVLVQSHSVTVDEPMFVSAVAGVVETLSQHTSVVENIVSPINQPNAGLISKDRHSALVQFDMKGEAADAKDKIAPS
jgi:RND superfamily putative drug exporter